MDREPLQRLICSLSPVNGSATGLSDAQLLERFVAARDEAAFELLLRRHGPAVLGVCRRLLSCPHDIEDVFQATFLALAKKPASIVNREAVGSWLYRVAYRVAVRARASQAKRARREEPDVDQLVAPPHGDPEGNELRQVLDEEVNRLPARHRAAFVLCCLEGKTNQEAARELGCRPGTVSSRLTRARERLRRRLTRRGLNPAGALAAVLSGDAPAVGVPEPLVGFTLKAALMFSAGEAATGTLPARAVAYAEGVLRAMFLTRLKVAALLLLVAGFLAASGIITRQVLKAGPPARTGQEGSGDARDEPGKKAPARPAVVRVVKPVAGAGRTTTQPCTAQAFDQVDVHTLVSGVLNALVVDIGSQVKKGQPLALIDAPLLVFAEKEAAAAMRQTKGQVREGQAKVAAAKAKVQAAKSVILQRQAEVDSAKATLDFRQRQLERVKKLHETNSVDAKAVDEQAGMTQAAKAQLAGATAALTNAEAEVEVKESEVAQANASLATTTANLEVAEVAVEKARYSLGLTKVLAPFDGVVTQRNYRVGQFLRAEGIGQLPLLTVQRADRVRVVVEVPENDVPLTEPGVPVDLSFDALPDTRYTGCTVARVGFAVDPKSRTMRVEIDVSNPKGQLRPGMYGAATLHFHKGVPAALRLPVSCLAGPTSGGKSTVYVVRDGKAHRTSVRVGIQDGKEVEILSGLKLTDQVVANAKGLMGEVVPVEVAESSGAK